jgi:predicted metal-dependent phosphoesterase TrpH
MMINSNYVKSKDKTDMLTTQFHCHTIASPDSLVRPSDLVKRCHQSGIDRIVITDHNEIAGAQEAQQLDPELVIIGEEIKTSQGELLAVYVKERIPPFMTPMETIQVLREQGAFISVSHPFDFARNGSWEVEDLLKIVPYIDAIEVFNARCMVRTANHQAQEFARQHHLAGTAGADAHSLRELDRSVMELPEFEDANSLRRALVNGRYEARLSSPFIHFTSRWAVWYKAWKNERNGG